MTVAQLIEALEALGELDRRIVVETPDGEIFKPTVIHYDAADLEAFVLLTEAV